LRLPLRRDIDVYGTRCRANTREIARADLPPEEAVANVNDQHQHLVWRFRSPHHSCRESKMRTSEPKPH